MKNLLFTILATVAILNTRAQVVQASIGPGSAPNRVKLYIRPNITLSTVNIGTLQFNIGVNASVTPSATGTIVSTNAPFPAASSWTISPARLESGYNNYAIYTTVSPITISTTANTEIEVMEIAFGGGSVTPQNVSLVCLPDGGTVGTALFYFTSSNLNSNGSSLYYARTASVIVNNQFSYDASGNTTGTSISTATIGNIILPTKFLSFYATKEDNTAKLSWTVDNEQDNQYFDVESSADGRNFTSVQRVNALRNGRSSNTYNANDLNISRYNAGIVYYRIKQYESSGNVLYSEIRQVKLDGKNFTVALYPNPVKTSTKLVVDAPAAGKATILVRDATGKTIKQFTVQLVKGLNQQSIDATLFPTGDYNVTIAGDNLNETIKMTKSN